MKKYTIYNGIENLTKKQISTQAAAEKRNVRTELAEFAHSLEYAGKQLTARDSAARNAANAAKGTYKTWLEVVANCYPYQTTTGALCVRSKGTYKVWTLRGRGSAGAVVSQAVQNYIDYKAGRKTTLVEIVEPAE